MRRAVLAALVLAGFGCKKDGRPPSLGEAISVEQPGGSVSQLFSQGSEIPTSATEGFTTAKDGESRIVIHVLRGAGRTADKLHSDGWWEVTGLTPGKAGEPQAQVTFEVDSQGQLALSAREQDRKLAVRKLDDNTGKLAPSPLTEPDDDEDVADDPE